MRRFYLGDELWFGVEICLVLCDLVGVYVSILLFFVYVMLYKVS